MSSAGVSRSRSSDVNVTYIGDLPGRYTLASRDDAEDGRVKVFACRARSISPQRAFLFAPVSGAVGERVAMRFEDIGILRATISRRLDDGFVADIDPAGVDIPALAARIDWLKQRRFKALADLRASKRWMPRQAKTFLSLADGRKVDCLVIDVSTTGAAVSADAVLGSGTELHLGAIAGRVVRKLDPGFAIEFEKALEPDKVEELLAGGVPLSA